MTPAQLSAILATVGLAFLAQAVACALLWRRVRALSHQIASWRAEPTDQIRALEARLARVEVGMTATPREPSPDPKRLHRLDRRQVALADGPVLIAVPSLASAPSATATAAAAEFDRRFGPIWTLADSGLPLDEIARQTGYPVGQVELILGLRGAKSGPTLDDDSAALSRDETDV